VIIVAIELAIAAVHLFRLGSYLDGQAFTLYYSFASDVLVPFGVYFLLFLCESAAPAVRRWQIKAGIVFAGATATEVAQAFGAPILGQTFDPVDIVMFGVGVLLAVLVDIMVFRKLVPHWSGAAKPQ